MRIFFFSDLVTKCIHWVILQWRYSNAGNFQFEIHQWVTQMEILAFSPQMYGPWFHCALQTNNSFTVKWKSHSTEHCHYHSVVLIVIIITIIFYVVSIIMYESPNAFGIDRDMSPWVPVHLIITDWGMTLCDDINLRGWWVPCHWTQIFHFWVVQQSMTFGNQSTYSQLWSVNDPGFVCRMHYVFERKCFS